MGQERDEDKSKVTLRLQQNTEKRSARVGDKYT